MARGQDNGFGGFPQARLIHHFALLLLIAASRLPLLGNYLGEPDTARYVLGLRFWLESGPGSAHIINRDLSPGYYALLSFVVRHFSIPQSHFPFLMNVLNTLATAIAGLALYQLATQFISARAAFYSTALFLMAPSLWWASIQPHPQMLAISLFLCAALLYTLAHDANGLALFLYGGGSIAFLASAFLIKTDIVLLLPGLLALPPLRRPRLSPHHPYSRLFIFCFIIVFAYGTYEFVKCFLLASSPHINAREALAHVQRYLTSRSLPEYLVNFVPVVFSHGVTVFVAVLLASILGLRSLGFRLRWTALVILWSLPSYAFWAALAGNNVRHLVLAPLPLFWLAARWAAAKPRWVLPVASVTSLAMGLALPANSGLNLFPSPNVIKAARLHRQKQAELRNLARTFFERTELRLCYVGAYTLDHVAAFVLDAADEHHLPIRLAPRQDFSLALLDSGGRAVRHIDFVFALRWPDAPRVDSCDMVYSLEYGEAHRRRRYFGSEWDPFWRGISARVSPLLRCFSNTSFAAL